MLAVNATSRPDAKAAEDRVECADAQYLSMTWRNYGEIETTGVGKR
jgi:hypothetical protein